MPPTQSTVRVATCRTARSSRLRRIFLCTAGSCSHSRHMRRTCGRCILRSRCTCHEHYVRAPDPKSGIVRPRARTFMVNHHGDNSIMTCATGWVRSSLPNRGAAYPARPPAARVTRASDPSFATNPDQIVWSNSKVRRKACALRVHSCAAAPCGHGPYADRTPDESEHVHGPSTPSMEFHASRNAPGFRGMPRNG